MRRMRSNDFTGPMRRVEARLGRPLEEVIRERYATGTLDDVAAELGVDRSTAANWMERLGIERRFPGQRPEAVA